MLTEKQKIENLEKCSSFISCSQNLCPLDHDIHLRTGSTADKCRWMREPKKVKIKKREFISGGKAMPDAMLNFVPRSNLKWLNRCSQARWEAIHN